jgi:hypothetical protein
VEAAGRPVEVIGFLSSLCNLCVSGYENGRYNNHRDTEDTEVAQRRVTEE